MKGSQILVSLAVASFAYVAPVQAKDIGIDIAKQIINGFAHKGIASIFNMAGTKELTPEKLNSVLDAGFKTYELNEVADATWGLRYNVSTYQPEMTLDTRKEIIANIKTDSETVLNAVGQNIRDMNSFWKLMPAYLYAKNVQLSFLAEEHAISNMASLKTLSAQHAATGLTRVREYFERYFRDETHFSCLYWDPSNPMLAGFQGNANQYLSIKKIDNHTMQQCWAKGHTLFERGLPRITAFSEKTVFKSRGNWNFLYKKFPEKDEYWAWAAHTQEQAQRERLRMSMDKYPELLSPDVSGQLENWYEIIMSLSTDNAEKAQARNDMIALGLINP